MKPSGCLIIRIHSRQTLFLKPTVKQYLLKSLSGLVTKKLYDLRKRNWAWHEILGNFLVQGIEFDPLGVAREWRPKKNTFPNVLVNPKIAFDQPVLAESGIPTQALRDAFDAERE